MGCGEKDKLSEDLVEHLLRKRKSTLDKIGDPLTTTIWKQCWKSTKLLNIPEAQVGEWNSFLEVLDIAHTRLIENDEELKWAYNEVGGHYNAKLGYQYALAFDPSNNTKWWKMFWKV